MPIQQVISLIAVFVVGPITGVVVIRRGQREGLPFIQWGLMVAVPGFLFALIEGGKWQDILTLVDVSAGTRAYMAGCLLGVGGIVIEVWRIFQGIRERKR